MSTYIPKDYALTTVVVVALACMMSVLIAGELLKPLLPKSKVTVPCSITIHDMARKMHITLLDSCVVEN